MEVKMNKEIRNYQESMFMGLNLRQCIFSLLAICLLYTSNPMITGKKNTVLQNPGCMVTPIWSVRNMKKTGRGGQAMPSVKDLTSARCLLSKGGKDVVRGKG